MRRPGNPGVLRVQGQGRAYAAVIGVTVGMLVAGLAVPVAFGRTPSSGGAGHADLQLDPGFATGASPGSAASPGAVVRPSTTAGTANGSAPLVGTPSRTTTSDRTATRPPGPSAIRLTATDVGVTATTVKLGVVLLDIQALQPLGFSQPHFSPREQRQQFQVFIDQANRAGGLSGRKITPVYRTYNALDTNGASSAAAVCIALAEDDKVFAAIGPLSGGIDVCLTQQYGIPTIGNSSALTEAYRKGHNLLVTPFASLERLASNWGDLSARSGLLRGRKTGTVSTSDPTESHPEQSLVNALAKAGHQVTYRAHLSSDAATGQSQLPVEIQKMQAAGVNTVFLVTNFIAGIQFVQTAQRQKFYPQYVVSDIGSLQAEGLVTNMPESFNGAYLFSQGQSMSPKDPENPQNKKCRDTFNAATGNHYAPGNESAGTYLFCFMVSVFTDAARIAGPSLTRARQALGVQHLSVTFGHALHGTFRPGKTDYADYFRTARYATSCKCYQALGGAQPNRY